MAQLRGLRPDLQGSETADLPEMEQPQPTGGAETNTKSQSIETPRQRTPPSAPLPQGGPTASAPQRPMVPTPQAGQASLIGQGVIPFQPLEGPSPMASLRPQLRSPYGTSGLTGGGLGLPQDPNATDPNGSISGLIAQLLKGQR